MSQCEKNTLVVVSHYNARGKEDLQALLSQLEPLAPQILVVINDDHHQGPAEFVPGMPTPCLRRANTGMNIGGWNEAFQQRPDFEHYIFLQDECRIKDSSFVEAYTSQLTIDGMGLLGECLNPRWSAQWDELEGNNLFNFPIQITPNSPPIMSIKFYKSCMESWGIPQGSTGRHLRALIWAISNETLTKINPFPVGRIREECIAAEIAISKKVEQFSLRVEQIDLLPFKFIEHKEWRIDGSKKKNLS